MYNLTMVKCITCMHGTCSSGESLESTGSKTQCIQCHVSVQLPICHTQPSQSLVMGHYQSINCRRRGPKHSVEDTGGKHRALVLHCGRSGKLDRRVK